MSFSRSRCASAALLVLLSGWVTRPSTATALSTDRFSAGRTTAVESKEFVGENRPRVPHPEYVGEIAFPGLGQIGGLATDASGRLVVFHRADRRWNAVSFRLDNTFSGEPIAANTLALIEDGRVVQEWGSATFYMPHGLTIDSHGAVWLTDVGAHQVYKFAELGAPTPKLTVGAKLSPGNDNRHFCKPTDVAVEESGHFFVADGYCNSRVVKFDPAGKFVTQWGHSVRGLGLHPGPDAFSIPHGLALDEKKGILYVADRENGRIQCFDPMGKFLRVIESSAFERLFAVEFSPADDVLYAVNGPGIFVKSVKGFTISGENFTILNPWNRAGEDFDQPHDVTVSPDGRYVYVGEIGPNRLTRFAVSQIDEEMNRSLNASSDAYSSYPVLTLFGTVFVAAGVIFVLGGVALVCLYRYRGVGLNKMAKFHFAKLCNDPASGGRDRFGGGYVPPMSDSLNLGTLLNRRQGFDRLSTEDGELDSLSQGLSDAEEYEATGGTTELNA